jgi:hypothetical protein
MIYVDDVMGLNSHQSDLNTSTQAGTNFNIENQQNLENPMNLLGNTLIKYTDKWRGAYYLKDDLTFTVNRTQAARLYLLKSGNSTILNGDLVTINLGNQIMVVDYNSNIIRFLDRNLTHNGINSFIITNGTENVEPIMYETSISLISDKNRKTALRYEWKMDLIANQEEINKLGHISDAGNYRPHTHPNLINGDYGTSCESYINTFQFYLEPSDGTRFNIYPVDNPNTNTNRNTIEVPSSKIVYNSLDGYKSLILILLLMITLVLCVLVSR